MARRFFVQGLGVSATDEQLKDYRTQIEAKGWKPVAQVSDPNGIVFEIADDSLPQADVWKAISGGSAIGVPDTYPRAEDPVVQRY